MSIDEWLKFSQIFANFANVVVAFGAIVAAFAYWKNSKLERARWLASLYEKFYEKEHLKDIRDKLDCKDEISLDITNLIREESSEFTDYLNFFEFVAFLEKSKQLKYEEVEQLFGYYLDCLSRRKNICDYIDDKGYELLSNLLDEFAGKREIEFAEKRK